MLSTVFSYCSDDTPIQCIWTLHVYGYSKNTFLTFFKFGKVSVKNRKNNPPVTPVLSKVKSSSHEKAHAESNVGLNSSAHVSLQPTLYYF